MNPLEWILQRTVFYFEHQDIGAPHPYQLTSANTPRSKIVPNRIQTINARLISLNINDCGKAAGLPFRQPCAFGVNLEGSQCRSCALNARLCQRARPLPCRLPWIQSNANFINASLIILIIRVEFVVMAFLERITHC